MLTSSAGQVGDNDLICLLITIYVITQKILARSAPFLWALSGLLASMSLHLGSVAVEISRVRKRGLRRGIRALRALLFFFFYYSKLYDRALRSIRILGYRIIIQNFKF